MKKEDERVLDGRIISVLKVAGEGEVVAIDDDCGVHECETGMREGGRGVSKKVVFKRERSTEKRRERMPT